MVMQQRLCPRCHHVVHIEDETSLVYCGNCGAPQVTVSEELREQAAQAAASLAPSGERPETEDERTARIAAQPPDLLIQWKSVLRIAVVVCGAISLVCMALEGVELLSWLAPGIVLAVYSSRHRETQITASMGARIGFLCGILCAFGITVANTLQLLFVRFGLHQGAKFDDMLAQEIVQTKANVLAKSGPAAASAAATLFDPLLNIPEYRVGVYLTVILVLCIILMALSTLSGAFSGYMRSRRALR